jgi:prepilin-type N-terminal cleavage/methylation domain-containing protein
MDSKPFFPKGLAGRVARAGWSRAFTLIEMLVVIGVIGLIAAMLVAFAAPKAQQGQLRQARAENEALVLAIETYHADFGSYPPDNTNSLSHFRTYGVLRDDYLPSLFYELGGSVQNPDAGGESMTFGTNLFKISSKDYHAVFGLLGPQNSSPDSLKNYLPHLRSSEYKQVARSGASPVFVLTCSIGTDTGENMNPWRYRRTTPTNNPTSYDLYVPLVIGKQTNIIGNWSP